VTADTCVAALQRGKVANPRLEPLIAMSSRFALLLLTVTLGAATVASAQDAPPPTKTEPAKAEQKLICKRERSIGSNMVKRVCRTEAQVEAEREAARQGLQTGDNRCMQGASCNGG
jgi:hypothetical protein